MARAQSFVFKNQNAENLMLLQLEVGQRCPVTVVPVDAKGKPSQVSGAPTWAASVGGIVTITPAADGLSADIVALTAGILKVNVSGDADLGPNTKIISSALDVEVLAAQAVGFQFTVGTPVDPINPSDNARPQIGPLDVGAYEYVPSNP